MAAILFSEATKAYPRTIAPAGKYPIVGDRIYATLQDAQDYVDGKSSSKTAIPGIYLSVIADGDNNGAYWVAQAAGYDDATSGILRKMNEGGGGTGGGGIDSIEFSLASNATNAVSLTINNVTRNITAATLKSSLGLGSLAYKSSLVASDIPSLPWSKITSGKPTTLAGYGVTDVVANSVETKVFRGETPSGGIYPRFRLFAEGNYTYLQAASADGASTQGAVVIGPMYGSKSLTEIKLMADKVGIMKTPNVALDVNGQLNSTNYLQGVALASDPTSSFQTTCFGGTSNIYRMRVMRPGNVNYEGVASKNGTFLALASSDTHAYISFPAYAALKDQCYIGGGISDALTWKATLFHSDMSLIPKSNDTYTLGNSSYKWKEVHAVSIKIGDATITWDASAGMLKADKGIYSTADIVAGK